MAQGKTRTRHAELRDAGTEESAAKGCGIAAQSRACREGRTRVSLQLQ